MGCTQYLIMLAAKPEYNEKVNRIIIKIVKIIPNTIFSMITMIPIR